MYPPPHYAAFNNTKIDNKGGSMINNVGSHNTVYGSNHRGMHVSGDYNHNSYRDHSSDQRIINQGGSHQFNMHQSRGNLYRGSGTRGDEANDAPGVHDEGANTKLTARVKQLEKQVKQLNKELAQANQDLDDANGAIEALAKMVEEYERRFGKI
ncbi:hypothetical protein AX16_010961 [Volvariella volvacea WC 439]|nr:hypothetical protein AX16_010961 [Volvariella volvacea WC 439]